MRRLPHLVGVLIIVASAILVFVGGAIAAKPKPRAGLHPVYFVESDPTSDGIVKPVYLIDPAGSFLPAADCGLSLQQGSGTSLTATVQGWETDPDPNDPRGLRVVWLHARVLGTVTDTTGNVYHVAGTFTQSGLQTWPSSQVPFDGNGQLVITGGNGIVRGTAEFRDVAEFPAEWDFFFSAIQICRLPSQN